MIQYTSKARSDINHIINDDIDFEQLIGQCTVSKLYPGEIREDYIDINVLEATLTSRRIIDRPSLDSELYANITMDILKILKDLGYDFVYRHEIIRNKYFNING